MHPDRPAARHEVVQLRDAEGRPTGYAMPLTTDVCTDNKCNILEVKLYWNEAGRYTRFECPPGKPLTKKEHTPFTPADTAKLDSILKNRDSLLARHSLAHLNQAQKTPDGIAGATPEAVREAVVQDAAYTSWVLWRYANGEIVQQLQSRTEEVCTPDLLRQLLRSGDGEQIALGMRYLNRTEPERVRRHALLLAVLPEMPGHRMPLLIDALIEEGDLPPETLERFTADLHRMPYYPVHRILQLLEQQAFHTRRTEDDVARLLDNPDFFLARRAYQHLVQLDGRAGETERLLEAFRSRYGDRL